MPITAHVYQIFIAATPDQVWAAITESSWTRRYFHAVSFDGPLVEAGRPYLMVMPDGRPAVDGVVEELTPPGAGTPGRLVQTWHIRYDDAMALEPPGRVEWTVEAAGEGLTRVRLVHGDLALSPLTWAGVKDGWVWVLDGLKTVLETGRTLPRPAAVEDAPGASDADWHRRQGVEANNATWELVGLAERTPDQEEELLRSAYAAAYHWQRARGASPANEARASYMIAKALLLAGQPQASLRSADRALATCLGHGLVDFDLAYAHEARARALRALGRGDEAAAAWALATAIPIADAEDREIVSADFADYAA